jgi:chemotaxis signal transduction protein
MMSIEHASASGQQHARVLLAEVGDELVAFPLTSVREVIDAPEVHALPLTPDALLGHLTLRAAHVPVLDAGRLLGIRATETSGGIALLFADGFAMLFDDAHDVWEQGSAAQLPIPSGTDRVGVLRGLLRRENRVASFVDADALSQRALAMLRELPHK